jgi:mono/diheme cytochrome c family protein
MRSLIPYFYSTLALLCVGSLQPGDGHFEANSQPANTTNGSSTGAQTTNAVRHLALPHFEPNMPIAPGRDEFMRACVTCHSARYVTMQPPFSRRQWEETVRKMINVYGATTDEFQIGKIIDYLYAIDGNGPRLQTQDSSADDDEIGATAGVPVPEATESAPVFEVASDAQDREVNAHRGAVVFREDCAGCHGDNGRGDGVASQALLPKPADLRAARFSSEFLRQTLWNGVRGAAMPSWRSLPLRDLGALTAYVQSLHQTTDSNTVAPESLAHGKALYEKNCLPCHGSTGDGKGPAGATLTPPPSNFKAIQPDFDYIQRVLRDGIPGASMPVWRDQLSESDRAAVAGYVRSLYESPK